MTNQTITLNTGTGGETLATDENASNEHYQRVKLVDGTDDSDIVVGVAGSGTATNAIRVELPTNGTGVVGLNAGSNVIGEITHGAATTAVGDLAKKVDQATTAADVGIGALARRTATPADVSGADLDYELLQMDNGRLWTATAGGVAHDAAYSENPLPLGAMAYETDGTAPGTAVAEADITRLKADLDGRLFVATGHPFAWSANNNSAAAETNTELKVAPGANLSLYITQVIVSSLTAQTTTITSNAGGTTQIPIIYTGANGNAIMTFDPPLRCAANVNVAYTTTAAVATSVLVNGYTAA